MEEVIGRAGRSIIMTKAQIMRKIKFRKNTI